MATPNKIIKKSTQAYKLPPRGSVNVPAVVVRYANGDEHQQPADDPVAVAERYQ
jgi:hypothetical protein